METQIAIPINENYAIIKGTYFYCTIQGHISKRVLISLFDPRGMVVEIDLDIDEGELNLNGLKPLELYIDTAALLPLLIIEE